MGLAERQSIWGIRVEGAPFYGSRLRTFANQLPLDLERFAVKQALAALRTLFDWLVVHQVVPAGSPFAAVRGPRLVVDEGRTPCLDGGQVVELFEVPLAEAGGFPR